MNQLITNKTKSKMIMRQILRKRKPCLTMRAVFLALCALIFVVPATAQVYMHSGTQTVTGSVDFYDSGGANSPDGSYFWEKWYSANENATLTFKNGTNPMKVTFNTFQAWDDSGWPDYILHDLGADWGLRINDDDLYIYDGEDETNLIAHFTGNIKGSFTVMANGPITFKFVSNGQYQEEGWHATVTSAQTFTPQPPIITKDVCDDMVILFNTTAVGELYYTIGDNDPDPNDPLSNTILYQNPFEINLDATTASVKVKAISYYNNTASAVVSHTFTHSDQVPIPAEPTITFSGNTVTITPPVVPEGLNETYNVRYTTDGSDPLYGTELNSTTGWNIECTTPNTTFRAITVSVNCVDKVSAVVEETFGNVTVPTPTITFNSDGTATITCSMNGATIYYTTDGTTPTPTNNTGSGTNTVTTAALSPGTTVYAYATYSGDGYTDSRMAHAIYVPEGGSGVYPTSGIVFLDDREDHNWSYYSDGDQPVHNLEPRDIKITYYGNSPAGRTTMTNASESGNTPTSFSATASGVAVNIDATGNQFIYLKTLEAANEDGSGNYPYTMIPNPFQVRPKYSSTRDNNTLLNEGFESSTISNTYSATGWYAYNAGSGNNWERNNDYGYTYNGSYCARYYYNSNNAANCYLVSAPFTVSDDMTELSVSLYERVRNGSYTETFEVFFVKASDITNLASVASATKYNAITSANYNNTTYAQKSGSNTNTALAGQSVRVVVHCTSAADQSRLYIDDITVTETTPNNYRGFYAWRIKSLSNGLTISGKSVNDIVYADEEITFETANAEGNEVEFEALWAQAYVATSTSTSGLVSAVGYERNFIVTTSSLGGNGFTNSVPATIMSIYPNGTTDGTTPATTNNIATVNMGDFSCSADTKFENIRLNGSNATITVGNNHKLVFGRGIGTTNTAANLIRGVSGTISSNAVYSIRLESGKINYLSFINGYYTTQDTEEYTSTTLSGSANSIKGTLGCDYDRANSSTGNDNLNIVNTIAMGLRVTMANQDATKKTLDVTIKSGKYLTYLNNNMQTADAYQSLYMSIASAGGRTVPGERSLTIEGGELANIAGGVDAGNQATSYQDDQPNAWADNGVRSFTLRMKGGLVKGAIYGGAAISPASGDRHIVITGGTVKGWIGGGCNGVAASGNITTGGQTHGESFVYVGGKTSVGGSASINGSDGGTVFGAGKGSGASNEPESGRMSYGTNVVIADECSILNNVYGGGNYGFAMEYSKLNILGGTVQGNVFGGSNQNRAPEVTINMKNGKINGNLYGGSNSSGNNEDGLTINVEGGTVTNVFGGGYGENTDMTAGTVVNISGGTINNNVYGGGEEGTVSAGDTHVNISGGTMVDVFGAGKGEEDANGSKAVVSCQTFVDVTGGTVSGSVYGGGEAGDIDFDGGSGSGSSEITYERVTSAPSDWSGTYLLVYQSSNTATSGYAFNGTINNNTGGRTAVTITDGSSISSIGSAAELTVEKISGTNYYYIKNGNNYLGDGSNGFTQTTNPGTSTSYRWSISLNNGMAVLTGQTYTSYHLYYNNGFITSTSTANVRLYLRTEHTTPSGGESEGDLASTVTIAGGTVNENVFGGGKLGKTYGAVQTNMDGGNVRGNVYGGAYGVQKSVFVNGLRTVNVTGGHVYGNVYGGSRNANDALDMNVSHDSFSSSEETATVCVTNISGGVIDQNVYAAGYYGNTFGSVYAFIGKNAIESAPYKMPTDGKDYKVSTLSIGATVWAGGDWGVFEGEFGVNTISGNSNIYVDGTAYETETNQSSNAQYMNIRGSILGCGTSCHAGKGERTIIVRNYGHDNGTTAPANATRTLFSIQFAKILIFDNAHINFTGQGKVNSLITTEQYAIQEIYDDTKTTNVDTDLDGVRIVNGSGLFLNAPVSQIANFRSMSCNNVYATTALDAYTVIMPSTLSSTPNKVRVNNGNYIEVKYGSKYYALIGYSYMMSSNDADDGTCAYARPRWCTGASFTINDANYDNRNDGGWVSYNSGDNTFALDGTNPGTIQMPYENHTVRNGEDYFRIWRVGGIEHYREGVFDAYGNGTTTYSTTDVTISLPAFRDRSNYYRFETIGDGNTTSIDYGADVLTFNAANYNENCANGNWMYYNEDDEEQVTGLNQNNDGLTQGLTDISSQPNVNFGLTILPSTGMAGSNYIICMAADENLANNARFTDDDDTEEPEVIFRLTYYNMLSTNMQWEPSTIVLEQCHDEQKVDGEGHPLYYDENGNETTVETDRPVIITTVTDRVTISLAVSTRTGIEQTFTTQVYAIMQGKGSTSETYTGKVVLPMFNVYHSGQESNFTVESIDFESANNGELVARASGYNYDKYAVGYNAAFNYDNTDGWNAAGNYTEQDSYPLALDNGDPTSLGQTGGRAAFAIDFTLHYDGSQTAEDPLELIGTLTYHITFDNYSGGTGNDHTQELTIIVEVWRRGPGSKFYLDGINGSNAYDAHHPDQAVRSLSTIFNRCGFIAGDEIYIVDTVKINKPLAWNGLPYENVTIYRYNGGHELATEEGIIGNPDNTAYTGALLYVTNTLTMQGITLDGYYNDGQTTYTTTTIDPDTHEEITETHTTDPNGGPHTVSAVAPMVSIAEGGTVGLNNGTVLQNNYNGSANGGAVAVNSGGTLMMNHDAEITGNTSANDGAGVYMAGTLVVSDNIKIYDNKKGNKQNNVYLTAPDNVVTIGTEATTDAYGALGTGAQIGVTKTLYADYHGYTRVVNVQSESDIDWLETPYTSTPNAIIFHDLNKYQLVKFDDPTYLYWIGTWVTVQDWNPHYESAEAEGYNPNNFGDHLDNIDTPEELAWLISYVNGLNGASEHHDVDVVITGDIDMNASIWVPIGVSGEGYNGYTGTFEGNGHVITGMRSPLTQVNMAMFGATDTDANIKDFVAKVNFDANSQNIAAVVATMNGNTTISNVEAAGLLSGGSNTDYIGGLVANALDGTIHSCFAVDTLVGGTDTKMGGLVAHNAADLYNSYANVVLGEANAATQMGGLVGVNEGHVENCYSIIGERTFPAFAYDNTDGEITICYTDTPNGYMATPTTSNATLSSTYGTVLDRKALGYMFYDNLIAPNTNTYVSANGQAGIVSYLEDHIPVWNGLLSALNQWVRAKNAITDVNNPLYGMEFTKWFRPTSVNINGDLPILGFGSDNCFATLDGRYLQYSATEYVKDQNASNYNTNDNKNGIDALLTQYKSSPNDVYIYMYNHATNVKELPGKKVNVFLEETAALIQNNEVANVPDDDPNKANFRAVVGITFENSRGTAGNMATPNGSSDPLELLYDWHMMASPLKNAEIGISYASSPIGFGQPANINGMSGNYFPDGLYNNTDNITWDLYSFYEKHYHWINLKRSSNNHWHWDYGTGGVHAQIPDYENETYFEPAKGYMMAIKQDSYLSDEGLLNNSQVPMKLKHECIDETLEDEPGCNLIGNPFHAYLNMNDFISANSQNTGISTYYVYSAEWNAYMPNNAQASQNHVLPTSTLAPFQGFFVKIDESHNNADAIFTNDMTTSNPVANSYFREERVNYPLVNLMVKDKNDMNDVAVIEFNRPEKGGAENVRVLNVANFDIYAHMDDKDYSILFTEEGTERVPVWFRTKEDGVFTMTWETLHGNFTSLRLIDNKTGVNYDMLANDSYTFEASTDDYLSRFYITFSVIGLDEDVNYESESFAFFNGSEWVINGKGHMDVIDITGRTLYAAQLNADQNRVNLDGLAKGVYLLRVIDNKVVRTQKIIVR